MHTINWGIIGCGDVTEVKSGPAFSKVPHSSLVAVMRRNAAKAADYAARHAVPKWYDDATALINDANVNAIYIATPPSTHSLYALQAIAAGKPVYVEKPMALNKQEAQQMAAAAKAAGVPLVVAHYRRQWPLFQYIRQLIQEAAIGKPRLVTLQLHQPALTPAELQQPKTAWRVNPELSGGGLFHDLAPHQLDILYYLFGEASNVSGSAINQGGHYKAPDLVVGNMLFDNGVAFSGSWCFTAAEAVDECVITGTKGTIRFSFFNSRRVTLQIGQQVTYSDFDALPHVQQPMIDAVVRYFRGECNNPCTADEGAVVMGWIEKMGTLHSE